MVRISKIMVVVIVVLVLAVFLVVILISKSSVDPKNEIAPSDQVIEDEIPDPGLAESSDSDLSPASEAQNKLEDLLLTDVETVDNDNKSASSDGEVSPADMVLDEMLPPNLP